MPLCDLANSSLSKNALFDNMIILSILATNSWFHQSIQFYSMNWWYEHYFVTKPFSHFLYSTLVKMTNHNNQLKYLRRRRDFWFKWMGIFSFGGSSLTWWSLGLWWWWNCWKCALHCFKWWNTENIFLLEFWTSKARRKIKIGTHSELCAVYTTLVRNCVALAQLVGHCGVRFLVSNYPRSRKVAGYCCIDIQNYHKRAHHSTSSV